MIKILFFNIKFLKLLSARSTVNMWLLTEEWTEGQLRNRKIQCWQLRAFCLNNVTWSH